MFGNRRARSLGGSVLAMACVLFGVPSVARAFEVKDASNGQPIHWETGSIVLQTDPSVDGLAPGAAAAIAEAVSPWSAVEGGPGISVQPAASPSQPAYDSRNVVYFFPQGYEAAGSALAITIVSYDDTSGAILDTDIVLNGQYAFAALPAGTTPAPWAVPVANDGGKLVGGACSRTALGTFDLIHVIAHETGHCLGLRDEIEAHAPVMYVYTLPGDASRRTPTDDDLDGLKDIYAGVSSARGCSSSTLSPKAPRLPPLVLAIALGTVAIGWVVAGRRRVRAHGSLALAGALSVVIGGPVQMHAGSAKSKLGDATARVMSVRDLETEGPWRTEVTLSPTECRISACPSSVTLTHWGGRRGHVVQQVGDFTPPRVGDEIEIVAEKGAAGASRFRALEDR
jgi:hypothetical protein